eukprot:GEMP01025372.1.p1 GENE.GEMP01025372.1~~GEMP01025372.1.p1  ORF type:complete len:535 (+),score=125.85 GEMP01025372.1:86-1690(+)
MLLTLEDDTVIETTLDHVGGIEAWARSIAPSLARQIVGDDDVTSVDAIKPAFELSHHALVHLIRRLHIPSKDLQIALELILPITEQIDDDEVAEKLVHMVGENIDPGDFGVLGPTMGTGSLRATLAILELYKEKQATLNTLEKALGQVVLTAKTLRSDSQSWNEHQMAVHAIRKNIVRKVQCGSYDATDDIPIAAFHEKSDAWRLVNFLDVDKVPPGMCSLMVLSLLDNDDENAKLFFSQTWLRSEPVQDALCKNLIPVEYLDEVRVRDQGKARLLMLRILENFEELPDEQLGRLIMVLLGPEKGKPKHIGNKEIKPELPLLTAVMRDAVKRRAMVNGHESSLMESAERLFVAIFLVNDGFQGNWGLKGTLPTKLLRNIVKTEDNLQLVRKAVLEHNEDNTTHSVAELSEMWEYCHWSLCQDRELIQRGMNFLAWRCMGRSTQEQADIFPLFTKLQFWRLPGSSFMSPYVPAPLLTSHVVAMYRRLENEVDVLQKAHVENVAEINALRATVQEMATRLEQTDKRSQRALRSLPS